MVFGALIIFFLIVEPHGLARWQIAKRNCVCGLSAFLYPMSFR
jgi:hypothetical protein